MEPARTIIKLLGGPTKVAAIAGVHRTKVHNWARPRIKGGSDGVIPFRHVPGLLNWAKENGVELSADDFIPKQEDTGSAQ